MRVIIRECLNQRMICWDSQNLAVVALECTSIAEVGAAAANRSSCPEAAVDHAARPSGSSRRCMTRHRSTAAGSNSWVSPKDSGSERTSFSLATTGCRFEWIISTVLLYQIQMLMLRTVANNWKTLATVWENYSFRIICYLLMEMQWGYYRNTWDF